jgi:hypothetical protein
MTRSWRRLAACALALAAACRRPGPPDPHFEQALHLYQQLYASELDEAYSHPKMEEVIVLLQKVDKRSVDASAAQGLLGTIQRGREEAVRIRVEREKLREAAAQVIATPSNIDPVRVLERTDAGIPHDPYGPDAPVHEINASTGGCLVPGEPFREAVTNRSGVLYRLAPNPVCRDKLPGFVGQVVMVAEGKIYRRILESQVPHPAAPDGGTENAGAAAAGASAGAGTRLQATAAADAGAQHYLFVPGGPLPAGATAAGTPGAGADGGSSY